MPILVSKRMRDLSGSMSPQGGARLASCSVLERYPVGSDLLPCGLGNRESVSRGGIGRGRRTRRSIDQTHDAVQIARFRPPPTTTGIAEAAESPPAPGVRTQYQSLTGGIDVRPAHFGGSLPVTRRRVRDYSRDPYPV